jgi:putative PIN family toxin of toxin-antitoxin system
VPPVHKILRVVIDTNHIMSAVLSSRGASATLIDWMTREEDYFKLLISQPIWNEYSTVADWLIPPSKQREKKRILNILRLQSEWIEPTIRFNICKDPSDNRFLECAIAGSANYLVTKNIRHFPPKEYAGVKIVRIRKFLKELEKIVKLREKLGGEI